MNYDLSVFQQTSPVDPGYNCIAWATGDQEKWWWPDPYGDSYWPDDVERYETIEAFVQMFSKFGYSRCDNDCLEEGAEKIALYADAVGKPTHAARQIANGRWTSKLGQNIDIEHDLDELRIIREYGSVSVFMKRPI